jgi:hypothetical protein
LALATEGRRPVPIVLCSEISKRLSMTVAQLVKAGLDLEARKLGTLESWSQGIVFRLHATGSKRW